MIFKLQCPIMSTTTPTILCYNKDRSVEFEMPVTNYMRELFDGELKVYVEGKYSKTNLIVEKRVPPQNW